MTLLSASRNGSMSSSLEMARQRHEMTVSCVLANRLTRSLWFISETCVQFLVNENSLHKERFSNRSVTIIPEASPRTNAGGEGGCSRGVFGWSQEPVFCFQPTQAGGSLPASP